jgi:multiple sugar transport system substrate-binding protein
MSRHDAGGTKMKRIAASLSLVFVLVGVACTGGGSSSNTASGSTSGSVIQLTMWMGYTPPPPVSQSYEYLSLQKIINTFNSQHPGIHVTMQYVNSDFALQKATVALQGNKAPDIAYMYGTNMPQVAQAPKLVDLTSRVQDPSFNWNDFFEGERAVATVDGKVLGVPALVDNLMIVYNKDLFKQAGLPTPSPDWTWDDVRTAAKALTDPSKQQFGLTFPADGSETTVWEYEAMLWEAGGDILTPDNSKAAFNDAGGVRALTTLQQMQQDGSLFLDFHPDAGKSENLFNSGNIGMIITGPWDLSSFPDVNYGVQQMPSFDQGGNHDTIAGPDNWVIFDNGSDRVNASWEFLQYLSSPDVVLQDSLDTGHLPIRASVEQMSGFDQFDTKYPGVGAFATNLVNVKKARPQITQYPQVSQFLGQAVVSVLLGQAEPQAALDQAAQQANGVLAIP